jgi:hypothetical protein
VELDYEPFRYGGVKGEGKGGGSTCFGREEGGGQRGAAQATSGAQSTSS